MKFDTYIGKKGETKIWYMHTYIQKCPPMQCILLMNIENISLVLHHHWSSITVLIWICCNLVNNALECIIDNHKSQSSHNIWFSTLKENVMLIPPEHPGYTNPSIWDFYPVTLRNFLLKALTWLHYSPRTSISHNLRMIWSSIVTFSNELPQETLHLLLIVWYDTVRP